MSDHIETTHWWTARHPSRAPRSGSPPPASLSPSSRSRPASGCSAVGRRHRVRDGQCRRGPAGRRDTRSSASAASEAGADAGRRRSSARRRRLPPSARPRAEQRQGQGCRRAEAAAAAGAKKAESERAEAAASADPGQRWPPSRPSGGRSGQGAAGGEPGRTGRGRWPRGAPGDGPGQRPAAGDPGARRRSPPRREVSSCSATRRARYFGLYTPQSPVQLGRASTSVAGKRREPRRPSSGYFQGWDRTVPARRGDALLGARACFRCSPGSRGRSRPATTCPRTPTYTPADDHRRRLRRLPARSTPRDIAAIGLPMAIRLDHEMNGDWYPWCRATTAAASPLNGNSAGDYIADVAARARHLRGRGRQRRTSSGSGRRTGSTTSLADFAKQRRVVHGEPLPRRRRTSTGSACPATTGRRTTTPTPTFDYTFGRTLASSGRSRRTSRSSSPRSGPSRPMGGQQADRGWAACSTRWPRPENADIVGFSWFNHTVATHRRRRGPVTNDWRIDSRADITRRRSSTASTTRRRASSLTPTTAGAVDEQAHERPDRPAPDDIRRRRAPRTGIA